MKKLVFMFAAFVAMTVASCGGAGTDANGKSADSTAVDTTKNVEVVEANVAVDSVVAE